MRIFRVLIAGVVLIAVGYAAVGSNQTAGDDPVATVTYCELLQHPKRFHNKVVRVTAIFEQGFEKSSLSDEASCNKGEATAAYAQSDTWVSYDKLFVTDGDSDEARNNQNVSGFGRWWLTAVGRFRRAEGSQRFGHLRCCKYEFALIRIEKSEKLPTPKP
jgi:hypothetical protein